MPHYQWKANGAGTLQESVRLIRVFLASPGDLQDERVAARDAADEINRLVARPAGYQIELLGWEETISGIGRPQSLINKELETCELFVGVIWKRWGTPPSKDGAFTSGFQEEYELSRERFDRNGHPQMGMFFKNVDPELLADPGDDLKKVLAFRDHLIEEKAHLFHSFGTKEEFAQRVRDFLASHVHVRARTDAAREEEPENSPKGSRSAQSGETENEATEAGKREARAGLRQDATFLGDVATKIHNPNSSMSDIDVARLRLIAVSVKGQGNSEAELGAHDANILYRSRALLDLSNTEINALARAGLANFSTENVPFWTWYAIRTSEHRSFLLLASHLGTEEERIGAIEALRVLGVSLDEDSDMVPVVRTSWFSDESSKRLKTAALRYLGENGTLADASSVSGEIEKSSSDTLKPAVEALTAIYLRHEPNSAAKLVLSSALESIDARLLSKVIPGLQRLSSDELSVGLLHRNSAIRSHTLELLHSRGGLDEASLRRAAEDDNSDVRQVAVRLLDNTVGPIEFQEAATLFRRPKRGAIFGLLGSTSELDQNALRKFKEDRFRKTDPKRLAEIAESESPDRDLALFCLAQKRYGGSKGRLRELVDDKFQTYITGQWPEGVPRGISNALFAARPPEEEKRRDLMRAALDVLVEKGEAVDLDRVRKAIDDGLMDVTAADFDFLALDRRWEDVGRITNAIQRSEPTGLYIGPGTNLFKPAAGAILEIAGDQPQKLIEIDFPAGILRNVLALYPSKLFPKLSDNAITELLLHTKDSVRKAAALKCLLTLPKRRMASLLSAYLQRDEKQFYNVIHWLDLGISLSRAVARGVATRIIRQIS